MYALPNKTQHKLIVKVRGGISQKLDNFTSATNSSSTCSSSSLLPSSKENKSSTSSLGAFSAATATSASTTSPFVAAGFGQSAQATSRHHHLNHHLDDSELDAQINQSPQPVFNSLNQHGNNKHKFSAAKGKAHKQQYITPKHNEMIKYVQQSWKGVERDYKKSVNNYINNIDINSPDHISSSSSHVGMKQQNKQHTEKKTATTSTPLLLTGSYHHTSAGFSKDSSSNSKQDVFRPFDLETFWGNRILKRLTEETL